MALAANYPENLSLTCDGALASEYGPYGAAMDSEEAFREHVNQFLNGMRERPEKIFASVSAFVADSRENLEKFGLWNEFTWKRSKPMTPLKCAPASLSVAGKNRAT